MNIFKFGGASVKDAEGVRNLGIILKMFPTRKLVVVISAMGKTTNALESLAKTTDVEGFNKLWSAIRQYHIQIAQKLFTRQQHAVIDSIEDELDKIKQMFTTRTHTTSDERYDRIVSVGELLATYMVSAWLNEQGISNTWVDARTVIHTDNNHREGKVDFDRTLKSVRKIMVPALNKTDIVITQGFIGQTHAGKAVTLGREGSDYTAAILAYCLDAEAVTIWKDVPGVLNADPKWFDNTIKLDHLSYQDAIELSYYGATVIHPKTIKPLQNKNIPLYVKSFVEPNDAGTCIDDNSSHLPIPCFIFKINQVLISVSPKDFSFIAEENLQHIFTELAKYKLKVNVMQNSALNFSMCMDDSDEKVPRFIVALKQNFRVLYNKKLELITIRYYDQPTIDRVCLNKKILLEHKSRYTVQLVVQEK